MKKFSLIVLLAVTHSTALAAGLGTNLNGDADTLLFPIKSGSLTFEPFLSYSSVKGELVDTVKTKTIGIGIFCPSALTDDISFYWGFKVALSKSEFSDLFAFSTEDVVVDEQIFAPTVGAEYFIHPRVSLSVEHSINFVSSEASVDAFDETFTDDATFSENSAILRIYFN
jgi:hypothetical protein